jgi:hypothetical protein
MNEADTGWKFVVPKLQAARWSSCQQEIYRWGCHIPDELRARWASASQRADCLKDRPATLFELFSPEAREILTEMLKKFSADGNFGSSCPTWWMCRRFLNMAMRQKSSARSNIATLLCQLQWLLYVA